MKYGVTQDTIMLDKYSAIPYEPILGTLFKRIWEHVGLYGLIMLSQNKFKNASLKLSICLL